MNMAGAWFSFVLLVTAVAGGPVMKYSFCPLSDKQCVPENFASDSAIDFGNIASEVLFYEEYEGDLLSVSCTFHEPLHWVLTAHEGERVNSISSSATNNGSLLLYYYHIHFNEATTGLIRCESYDNPGLAAEIYIAQREQSHEFHYSQTQLVEFYPPAVSKRGGQLIVPCFMNTFGENFDVSAVRLQKLKRDVVSSIKFNMPNVTSECLNCFTYALSEEANCNATSCPYGISHKMWNHVCQPFSDNGTGNQCFDCASNPECALETIIAKASEFEKLDCNDDAEITCSDHFSAISSYPSICKQRNANSNFKTIEACINNKLSQELNYTEADYDPRLGFRLKREKDMEAVYVCGLNTNLVYLSPYDPRIQIEARLQITDNNMSDKWTGILCAVPPETIRDVNLVLFRCSSLFGCEVQQSTIETDGVFRSSNDIEGSESITNYYPELYGRLIKNPPRSGVVKCVAASAFNTGKGFVYELKYFFTGLDSKLYFVSNKLPVKAVISLNLVQKNLPTSDGFDVEVECTVATFIVFPRFQFLVEYSNGTVMKTEQTFTLQQRRSAGSSQQESQRLKQSVNDLASVVSITCRSPFRNSIEHAEAVLTMEDLIINSDEQESPENNPSPRVGGTSLPDYLVVVLAVTSVTILLGSVTCAVYGVRKYKKSKEMRKLTLEEINEFWNGNAALTAGSSNEVNIDGIGFPECFQIPPADLKLHTQEILGEGEFGLCISGDYQDLKVAVKTTKASVDAEAFKDFLREVKIMAYLGKHENVVEFLGAVVNQLRYRICLAVAELSPYGDLLSFLRRNDTENPSYVHLSANLPDKEKCTGQMSEKLGINHLIHFCEQIAAAMEFVVEKRVIHGDLAARNVLVFPDYVIKITDFGLSRKLYMASNYKKKSTTPLPWRWMALESLKYMEFSPMTDMWAYGITAWEIFTMGQVPYAGLVYSLEFVDEIDGGLRLQCPKNTSEEIFQFMKLTWDRIPSARPSFEEAKNFFGHLSVGRL